MAASSAVASAVVRGGVQQMQQFLQKEKSRFRSMILVVSAPIEEPSAESRSVLSHSIRHTQYLLQQKLGYSAIIANCSSSAFPTFQDVENVTQLAQRMGADVIAAVGSGNAIDVAKAAALGNTLVDKLLLIPLTYGASIAALSSHALLYDETENAVLPQPQIEASTEQQPNSSRTVLLLNDRTLFDTTSYLDCTLLALLSLLLDWMYQHGTSEEGASSYPKILSIAEEILACLTPTARDLEDDRSLHDRRVDLCQLIGHRYLSFGGHPSEPRCIPLALATSLIPHSFSQYSLMTVLASFVPAYCEILQADMEQIDPEITALLQRIPVAKAPKIITNEPYGSLLSHIHANQALWNCYDTEKDDTVYRSLLRHHMLY
jgi:Iron-containing alcohol dehydrogenase